MENWAEADAAPAFEAEALAEATKPEHSGRTAAWRLAREGGGVIRPTMSASVVREV